MLDNEQEKLKLRSPELKVCSDIDTGDQDSVVTKNRPTESTTNEAVIRHVVPQKRSDQVAKAQNVSAPIESVQKTRNWFGALLTYATASTFFVLMMMALEMVKNAGIIVR